MIHIIKTGDGSHTLHHAQVGENYHSVHGAETESRWVFIRHGLEPALSRFSETLKIMEVGLGTGLNLLLTMDALDAVGRSCCYLGLEPAPLSPSLLQHPGFDPRLSLYMEALIPGVEVSLGNHRVRLSRELVQNWVPEEQYHLIYMDAFSPERVPEQWSEAVLNTLASSLVPGGILVTYSAKGSVRRCLNQNGLEARRLPGPPGKFHMLQACKPLD